MKESNTNNMLEQKIKNTLCALSEEQELKVFESNVDLSMKLDKKTTDRTSERVYKKLGIPPKEAQKKKHYGRPILYVAAILAVIALSVTAICAKDTPLRDRIIKLFSDTPAETKAPSPHYPETVRDYPYLSSPEYPSEKYPVKEYVDFSHFDYSDVDEIVVRSGMNGAYMTFADTNDLLAQIKKLTCSSPVTARGISGFHYHIKIRSGNKDLYSFSITGNDNETYIFYDVYEKIGNFKYPAMYTADEKVMELINLLDSYFQNRLE